MKTGNPFRKYAERQVQKKYPAVFELLNDKKLRETDQTAITIKANKVYKTIKERKRQKEEISEAKKALLKEIKAEKDYPTKKQLEKMNMGRPTSAPLNISTKAAAAVITIACVIGAAGYLLGVSTQPWFVPAAIVVWLASAVGVTYGSNLYSAAKIKTLEDAVNGLDEAYAKIGKA